MLQPIISTAPTVSHHAPTAEGSATESAVSEGAPRIVPLEDPKNILSKVYEKVLKMKAALSLAPGSSKAIADAQGPAADVAPVATPAPAPAATVAPAASASEKGQCRGCGHELAEDEKTYHCSACSSECCDACADETDDGRTCQKCGGVAASAVDTLVAKMNASTCPEERYNIAARINQLEGMAFVPGADKKEILAKMEEILDNVRDPQAIVRLACQIDAIRMQQFIPSAAALENEGASVETLLARLGTATDSEERHAIAARINFLEGLGFAPAGSKGLLLAQMEEILDNERDPQAIVRLARKIDALKS